MGAGHVTAIDVDEDALETFRENLEIVDYDLPISIIQYNLENDLPAKFAQSFDTTLMNPPFGTRTKGIDMVFLQRAMFCTRRAIYSMHKKSTRSHIAKQGKGEWVGKVVAEMKFDIKSSYKFHKKNSVDIDVDVWRFERIKH